MNSKQGNLIRYRAGQEPDKEGTIMFADFILENCWFAAMDSAHEHNFTFNEAISFLASCENQEENDYYCDNLSAVPEAEQCVAQGQIWCFVADRPLCYGRNDAKRH